MINSIILIELLNIMTKPYNDFLLLIQITIVKSRARDDLISLSILYWTVRFLDHCHKQELIAVSDRKVWHANADKTRENEQNVGRSEQVATSGQPIITKSHFYRYKSRQQSSCQLSILLC